ncbi:hypothetical protein BDR22DRAFT_958592 [Usnea florida]
MSLSGLKARFSLPHRRNRVKPDANESIQPLLASRSHVSYAGPGADLHSISSNTDKTGIDRCKQPAASEISPSQPLQTSDKKLDVIFIPCSNDYTLSMSQKTLSLVSSITMDYCTASEKLLRRIPYVPKESFAFTWSRRSLLSVSDKSLQDIDREWHADYMMYVCLDEDAGLARNKYLESVSGVYVYGDAFLFKLKRGGLAKLARAEYVDMNDDFGRGWRSIGSANNILRKLLDPQLQDQVVIQPYMKILISVDAFRLPCDYGSGKYNNCLENIPLVDIDTKANVHKEVETRLRRVPDLRSYEKHKNFDWNHRTVVNVSHRGDDFVMYLCLEKDARLPVNQNLKRWDKFSTPDCYGDAFIFKVHSGKGSKGDSSPAKYHHIGQDAVSQDGQIGSLAVRILEEVFHKINQEVKGSERKS